MYEKFKEKENILPAAIRLKLDFMSARIEGKPNPKINISEEFQL